MPARPLVVLWRTVKGSRLLFGLALLCVVAAAFVSLLDPLILRFTLDSVLGRKPPSLPEPLASWLRALGGTSWLAANLWLCGLALLATSLVGALLSFARGSLSALAAERSVKRLRDGLAAHLDALPTSFFADLGAGDLVQRATSDVDTVRRLLATQIEEVGRSVSLLLLTVILMLGLDLPMTLVSVPVIPAVFGFSYIFFRKIQRAFKVSDEAEAALTQVIEENLRGIRVVRAFNRGAHEIERHDGRNRKYVDETRRLITLFGWYWGISVLLCSVQEVVTIGIGAGRVGQGLLTAGTYLAFVAYVGRVLWPVRQLGRTLTEVGKARVSLGRIAEILGARTEAELDAAQGWGRSKPAIRGPIEFEGVTVEYEAGRPALKDLSFRVEEGETLAILGRTGSGKSSMAAVLLRLVEPQVGRVRLGGIDIREIDRRHLRESVGLVLQEPYLFSRSLQANVELGSGPLGDGELERAGRLSGLAAVVESFPAGWATEVGEGGVTLSGGQRQRLAIARVLAKRPPILILDDSLSALDTETEAKVRRALRAETGTTTIIVAHRITTLMGADRILVLEDGKVADSGTHAELSTRPGLYRRVWELQSGQAKETAWKR